MQALQQLWGNKLRSVLSLLGITIGIWSIIAVFSAIDSLEANIRGSFEKLGDDVIYISKNPWGEDPDVSYWKYMKRPRPSYEDMLALREKVETGSLFAHWLFIVGKTVEYKSANVTNVVVLAATYDYAAMFSIEFDKGRYFSPNESTYGSDVVVMGYEVAKSLFSVGENPIGKKIKCGGRFMQVIGVIKKAGNDLINPVNFDNCIILSYSGAQKFVNLKSEALGSLVAVKADKGVPLKRLKDDITGVLRAERKLPPLEKDNFSLNSLSIISNAFDSFFGVMKLVGFIIGIFSIIVGVFGVANIMFVSVKERTNLIGIKKALGAKSIFILAEFLIEAVVLCIIGGILGLLLVWAATKAATSIFGYEIFLSFGNVAFGIGIAVVTGILSGIIPAIQAARMDPVEAIRQ